MSPALPKRDEPSVPLSWREGPVSDQPGGDAAPEQLAAPQAALVSTPGIASAGAVDGHLLPQQRALLDRLANGETIAAAAAAEFLSLRTANRRIAQARELLGVRTTREAVLRYVQHHRQP